MQTSTAWGQEKKNHLFLFIYLLFLETESHYIAQAGLNLLIFLPQLCAGIIGMHHPYHAHLSLVHFEANFCFVC
jgi:hypothetical protein